jgi:hypothetical protein
MERKTAGLLGALAGLATLGTTSAQAASNAAARPDPVAVASYADLLKPVPDAVAALQAHNAAMEQAANAPVQQADWRGNPHHHHHHHHHHAHYRPPPPPRWHHHHHHHHHHSGAVILAPGIGVRIN